ncbi:MAG: hypothetical protein QW279_00710 [Candidatus Jordarchaeaceae archaeon]
MSLTSFLRIPDVRKEFSKKFSLPKNNLVGEMFVPPKSKHYSLVGTAFDYLMRFYLKSINPKAITRTWIAENAVELIQDTSYRQRAIDIIKLSKQNYHECLKNGKITKELIVNCLQLAQLDNIFRSDYLEPNLGVVDELDVSDLENLLELAKKQDFHAKKICVLNPTFGKASLLVGGADMDILLDGSLIDIKTTKFLELKEEYYYQLIGYYILSRIGGIDGVNEPKIENLAVYYSRHGILLKIPIENAVGSCDLSSFINWFVKRATQEFAHF